MVDGRLSVRFAGAPAVVWAATMITPAVAQASPERVREERAAFEEFLRLLPEGTRLIVLSSGGTVYSGPDTPYRESTVAVPANEYGAAKLDLERLAHTAGDDAVVLRVSNAYGPGQAAKRGQGVIGHWMTALREGKPITIFGDGSAARDYVFVDDVVDAVLKAIDLDSARGGTFNIGSGVPTTLTDLVGSLQVATGAEVCVEYLPDRGFDVPATWLDVEKARIELGWTARVGTDAGLARTWAWFQTQRIG